MLAGDEPDDLRHHWVLDPNVIHLNHGSFGACPRVVLAHQRALQDRMERNPMQFFMRDLEQLLDEARTSLGAFVDADPDDLVFVPNATAAINAVLRSLDLASGDELLISDHAYNACRNALDFVAQRTGARVVVAKIPFPISTPHEVTEALLAATTTRTKLALIDHVTSPTALIFPVEAIVKALRERGIDALIDGAHAPGMLDLSIESIGAAYYTGNCHKWVCAPKGSAFLHVRRDKQSAIRPLSISHGANADRPNRSRFKLEFDWVGTDDPTGRLSIASALTFLGSLWPTGHKALMARNRALALRSQLHLAKLFGEPPPAPPEMIGAIASIPIRRGGPHSPTHFGFGDSLAEDLATQHRIEIPVLPWSAPYGRTRLLRVSAGPYTRWADVQSLEAALSQLLPPTSSRDTGSS